MNILVIGGTGLIGGHAALHLRAQGNAVTIAARKPPAPGSALAQFDVLQRDYVAGDFTRDDLARFDAVVFAAGNDIRHLPPGTDEATHWERANVEAVPRFFALARDAGVKRAVLVGSFYPQVAPQLVDTIPYVRSRHLADERVRALATPSFSVCSVNAPFVVGSVPGLKNEMFAAYTGYAQGKLGGLPVYGPAGGSNFISTQSLSEAIWGALQRGESGRAYLVGDENLSFADYFAAFFRAAGNPQPVPALDQEHPLLPDIAIYTGRGNVVSYEPDPADLALLRYRRGDVQRAVDEVVAHCGMQ
ncbi:NAD-dependent epimerase/dehydratase family protein [Burkholderia guangdongensis]|uniref:NAD-dependent epimerase/dehydratase family protein n=1 Tax=Burkholderia guangdongensis TaxID=1792500 RepID=UPI0015CA8F08|nr:NAD-dependent epimerase/dehydratase family protein [Burkholderia guangdongensis]